MRAEGYAVESIAVLREHARSSPYRSWMTSAWFSRRPTGGGLYYGAERVPASVPDPDVGTKFQSKDPLSRSVIRRNPWVSLNRFTMYDGLLVKGRRSIPPVETWNAVIPSLTHSSALFTGHERS
jgi:hypothetical protein